MNHGVRHKPPRRHHRPLGWAMLGAAACIASALAEPAPISPSNLLTPAQPLTPVDQRFQDLNPLATSLRSLPTDLRQPSNFDRVYRVRTPGGAQDEQFARVSGALTALFPRSEYTQTKRGTRADVPAGTIFYIGGLPHAGPGRIGPHQLGVGAQGSPWAAVERADSLVDRRFDPFAAPARVGPADPLAAPAEPDRSLYEHRCARVPPAPHIFTDEAYRARRLRELLTTAAANP